MSEAARAAAYLDVSDLETISSGEDVNRMSPKKLAATHILKLKVDDPQP
tara:strand:+ start:233 stop:379 length:147 start_codon:yes stop_codon:yes gene_type:complete